MMEIAIRSLTKLGLTDYEARAYIALLGENPLTAYEIAKGSGIPTSKIYETVNKLETKHIIQSVHGERSRMFIPIPPEELTRNYRSAMEENLSRINNELKDAGTGYDRSYTWHIKNYEGIIEKATRMIQRARSSILLSIWPNETELLMPAIEEAQHRGIKIAAIHYGPTHAHIGQTYIHPVKNTLYSEREGRNLSVVTDSREALNGRITDRKTEAIWSMNAGFVNMADSYIRHDIYQMKTMKRLDPLLRSIFGDEYEIMRDVFNDCD